MDFAYCTAKWPSPPPAPGRTFDKVSTSLGQTVVNAHNPLTRLDSAALASCVSGNPSAHDGSRLLIRNAVRKAGGVPPVAQGILLEGSGGAETRVLLLSTMELVDAIRAELAFATSTPDP